MLKLFFSPVPLLLCAAAAATLTAAQTSTYCAISVNNTMCKYNPTTYGTNCKKVYPVTITAADKQLIVDTHNNYRRRVAAGNETRGNPGPQPAASNMRELSWDDELALMAQTHVQQCVYQHDVNRDVPRFRVGQNLAIQFSTAQLTGPKWVDMIKGWYEEVTAVNKSFVSSFPLNPGATIGHYTQLVWATSYKIGCGILGFYDNTTIAIGPSMPYKLYYACNYGPAGNFIGSKIYTVGTAATACPTGTVPKNGLCA